MSPIPWLSDNPRVFPDIEDARDDPNGLLAVGGDLSSERLVAAYRQGIFPWFNDDQPMMWWSPDPRCVIDPALFHPSRSLSKRLKKQEFELRVDTAFEQVIQQCRTRGNRGGTWITDEMKSAYIQLFRSGVAHSIECFSGDELVGGLYGLSIGKLFFGESMFHRTTDASKAAFAGLMQLMASEGCPMVDCQLPNPHLMSLGATEIPRTVFRDLLVRYRDAAPINWEHLRGDLQVVTLLS